MRKLIGLVVVLCVTGLVAGQDKKGKVGKVVTILPAVIEKVDIKKSTLTVKSNIFGSKTFKIDKSVEIVGPKGGKMDLKDKRLKPGQEVGLQMDGSKLEKVRILTILKDKAKPGEKDKK